MESCTWWVIKNRLAQIIRIIMEVAKHSSHNQRPQGKKTNLLTQRLERLMSDIRD